MALAVGLACLATYVVVRDRLTSDADATLASRVQGFQSLTRHGGPPGFPRQPQGPLFADQGVFWQIVSTRGGGQTDQRRLLREPAAVRGRRPAGRPRGGGGNPRPDRAPLLRHLGVGPSTCAWPTPPSMPGVAVQVAYPLTETDTRAPPAARDLLRGDPDRHRRRRSAGLDDRPVDAAAGDAADRGQRADRPDRRPDPQDRRDRGRRAVPAGGQLQPDDRAAGAVGRARSASWWRTRRTSCERR